MGFAGLTGVSSTCTWTTSLRVSSASRARRARLLGLSDRGRAQESRRNALSRAVASLAWNWETTRPILIGDRIHAEIEVQSKRETKRADRGILVLAFKVKNQNGEVVQEGTNDSMVLRKP